MAETNLHKSAKREEIAAHNEGFLAGFAAGVAASANLMLRVGLFRAAAELEAAKVVEAPAEAKAP